MSLASRAFLIFAADRIQRLYGADFQRLCSSTEWYAPSLAGLRVQWASVVVELFDRHPVRIVQSTFAFMHFDARGALDVERMNREQVARFDVALSALTEPVAGSAVVDATSRFAARGGTWTPDRALLARLDAAALGRSACARVKVSAAAGAGKPPIAAS
jgi:hypothetical protein